jgi:hypothetical protein
MVYFGTISALHIVTEELQSILLFFHPPLLIQKDWNLQARGY